MVIFFMPRGASISRKEANLQKLHVHGLGEQINEARVERTKFSWPVFLASYSKTCHTRKHPTVRTSIF